MTPVVVASVNAAASGYCPSMDDLRLGSACLSGARLQNSEALVTLGSRLSHLSRSARSEIVQLDDKYSSLMYPL